MMKDGQPLSFWFSLSAKGGRDAEDNPHALADGFDVRRLPEQYRDGLDLQEVWSTRISSRADNAYERWLEVVRVAIRKALNAGYDLRQANDPRDLAPPQPAAASTDVDIPF
jgi:hypothetical protein